MKKFSRNKIKFYQSGVVAIPFVLTIGGILVVIAIALSAVAFRETSSESAFKFSTQAYYLADAAVNECIYQLSNTPSYDCTTINFTNLYQLGSATTSNWSVNAISTNPARARATVGRYTRTIEYSYLLDAST